MKLTFIGAAHEVTGSCHYLEACGKHILIDCGLEQGPDLYENQEIPINPSMIDYILLTHAHIDHSGKIPLLVKNGFKGEIICTFATSDLCSIMLRDSAHIQESEAEWQNRKALRSGAQVVIQHISSGQSVELVRTFKAMGANLHAEATPHHFTLTDAAVLKYGALAKMNPPLRTENDRLAIIEGLKDGTIDLIATDHAPHSTEEKSRPITQTPSGIIGLETSLALGITSLVRPGHLTLSQLIEKMTINPASLYHLPCGSVAEGKSADLVLFDQNEKWTPETYASKSSNSPFTGWELYGKVKYTICDGKIVYKD